MHQFIVLLTKAFVKVEVSVIVCKQLMYMCLGLDNVCTFLYIC